LVYLAKNCRNCCDKLVNLEGHEYFRLTLTKSIVIYKQLTVRLNTIELWLIYTKVGKLKLILTKQSLFTVDKMT